MQVDLPSTHKYRTPDSLSQSGLYRQGSSNKPNTQPIKQKPTERFTSPSSAQSAN